MLNPVDINILSQTLQLLGISSTGSQVYLKLLSEPGRNLSQIAKELAISRPHLYKLIAELEAHELLHFEKTSISDNRIQVNSPANVLQKIRQSKNSIIQTESDILKVLPNLMTQFDQGSQASKIRVVTGAKDFFNLLMSIADEENKSIIYFGSIDHFIDCVTWTNQDKWLKARVATGLKIQALLTESAEAYLLKRKDKEQLRETRILKNHDDFVTSYHVFSNKTIFWQPKAKLAILIEDQHIARMMKMIFQSLWEATGSKVERKK